MTRPRPNREIEPRMLNAREVAHRLGRCEGWFNQHYEALRKEGFPERDPLLGGWDSHAIDIWLDIRSGLRSAPKAASERRASYEGELIRRARQWPAS